MLKSLLKPNVESILNDAISEELHASHLYRHLSAQCQRLGLFGASKYFKSESADELEHYQFIVDYINDRGSVAKTPDIASVTDKVNTLESALTIAYNKELSLGIKYDEWYEQIEDEDPTTARFLLQFLEVQQRSIGEYGDLLARLKLADNEGAGILIIDKEMGG